MPIEHGPFKDQLMSALHTAVQDFNTNQDPNEAVVKAAQSFDFNTEQTKRLVESFNTARTIFHYKHAEDRTVAFDLADSTVVLPKMFSPEPETKAASVDLVDYSCYDLPEARYEDGLDIKAAGVRDFDSPEPVSRSDDTSLDTQGWRAARAVRVMRDLSKTAEDESRLATEQVTVALTKLALAFTTGYEDVCIDRYGRFIAGYEKTSNAKLQERYGPIMTKLAEFIPPWLREGALAVKTGFVVYDSDLGPEVDLLNNVRDWMEVEAEFLATASVWDKDAAEFETEWAGMVFADAPVKKAETLADFVDSRLVKSAGDLISELESAKSSPARENAQKRRDKEKEQQGSTDTTVANGRGEASGPGITAMLGGAAMEGVKKPVSNFVESGLSSIVTGPQQRERKGLSERLQNTQRQIMLEDLLTNDPVLSDETPETVAQAYGAILKIAPEVATNKEVVRAILRQVVHSVAVSPYDAQTWVQLEQSLKNVAGKGGRSADAKPAGGPQR